MVTIRNGNLLTSDCEVICHQTNCMGAMGGGIAREIRSVYPEAYVTLRKRFELAEVKLGEVDFVPTIRDGFMRCIVNCYGQMEYLPRGVNHTDYDALQKCFDKIKEEFVERNYTIGFPYRFGCGLAGGDWPTVLKMITDNFGGDDWRVEIWRLKD